MNLAVIARSVHNQLFNYNHIVTINNKSFKVQSFEGGSVKGINTGIYSFLTQNPNKPSRWGALARAGHQITWVIQNNNYIGRVHNGIYTDL